MAQAGNCEQFEVGTEAWTDCIHDSATGGGLMPWIVVIPLAVMVVGMMIGFARQFSPKGRERARQHGAAGTAGSWLIFVSFVELAIGMGSVVAARRAPGVGGGYDSSATVLLGVGTCLFVAGVYLKIRGRRRAKIFNHGVAGEALIRDVHETGTMVNNQPMYAFDLEVSGSGFSPVTTTRREVIPFWFLNRVGPGSRIPVKVDPADPTKVIFDWDQFRSMATPDNPAAGAALQPGATSSSTLAGGAPGPAVIPGLPQGTSLMDAVQAARSLQPGGSGFPVGKAIGFVVVFVVLGIIGAGLFFLANVIGDVSDVTSEVTDQVQDAREDAERVLEGAGSSFGGSNGNGAAVSKIEVSRSAKGRGPVGYSLELPVGWLDLSGSVPERQPPLMVDLVLKPQSPSEARIVVTRSLTFLEDPAPANADVGTIRRRMLREYGDGLAASGSTRLAGEPALRIDVVPGADGLRSRQIAVLRGGQVIFLALTAHEREWRSMLPVFEEVAESWRWS